MGEARRKKANGSTKAHRSDHQIMKEDGISSCEIHHTMEAAWAELAQDFFADLPKKQREDAKFIFFNGVRAAANLMIYCAGQQEFEAAADQITKECLAYQDEAMAVLEERKKLTEHVFAEDTAPN